MLLKEALASVSAVVLASGSPRRKELLGLVLPEEYGFEVQTSDFDENLPKDTDAADYALRTATAKGEAVVQARNAPDELVISADTVVVRKDKILEKPRDDDHARDMLSKLSGKTHKVITGVALFHKGRSCGFHACTKVTFSKLPAAAIDDYVAIASFVYFGAKSISDALGNEDAGAGMAEELDEAEQVLAEGDVLEKTRGKALRLAGEAFALTVAAEVGDRSQLATIALSAAQNPYLVCAGACFGHGLATGIAVVGGAFISRYTNERTVGLVGGVLFLVFAATTALGTF